MRQIKAEGHALTGAAQGAWRELLYAGVRPSALLVVVIVGETAMVAESEQGRELLVERAPDVVARWAQAARSEKAGGT
jgi:hypothetical protein